ncbi:MAG: hypothetical protein U0232_32845 [Thermomicrobiales bacterium]
MEAIFDREIAAGFDLIGAIRGLERDCGAARASTQASLASAIAFDRPTTGGVIGAGGRGLRAARRLQGGSAGARAI